jgi:hypothetical protein
MKNIPTANSQQNVVQAIINHPVNLPEKPIWIKNIGDWNHMPTPFKKLTDKNSIKHAIHQIIDYDFSTEFRQVEDLYSKEFWNGVISIKIFYFYNYAIGLAVNPKTEELEFYRIGCDHKNTYETQLRKSYYRVTCKDCGFEYEYDCSD